MAQKSLHEMRVYLNNHTMIKMKSQLSMRPGRTNEGVNWLDTLPDVAQYLAFTASLYNQYRLNTLLTF